MKNIATNQKLILLMLITAFLMCWVQGVSHGGSVIGGVGEALGAAGTAVVTAVGAGLGAAGTVVGVAAGAVLIAAGVLGLSVRLIATVVWHTDSLSSMAVIPNGGIIGVVASNLIHLGDPHAVAPHTTLTYDSPINNIAFSPNGTLLASGSVDNTVQLWIPDTETLQATLQGHTDSVLSVAFDPNGALLASGSADGTVRLWNTNTETLQATLEAHTSNVLSVAFSPDGSLLASGSADGTVRLWDPVAETLEATLEAHMDSVLSVAFSPDGLLLASASADGLVGLWDTHTEILQATLGHESPVLSVAFSPDGDLLASGSSDGVARLWDPHTPQLTATLGHESPVESVAFDGSTLVTGSQDGRVRQWEITISPDGIRDISEPLRTLTGHTGYVRSVAFSPDGQTLASGSNDRTVRLWDANTGEHLRTLTRHDDDMNSVAFSPDGQTLASGEGSFYGALRLWNTNTGALLHELVPWHNKPVRSVAFSPDGQILASSDGRHGAGGSLRLWNANTGEHLRTLAGHSRDVNSVAFSPDGQTLASASIDKTVRLWDANTGEHLRTLAGHMSYVRSVAFSPDGQILASSDGRHGAGGSLRLWNANTGEHLRTLAGHSRDVNSVAFSPDGQTLASGSDDDTVRLWDANTGEHLHTFAGHSRDVNSVAFSPDGQTLASGSSDKTVRLWELTPNTTAVSLLPASVQSPAVGDSLTLNLTITRGFNVAGYQATVQFDTTALRYVEGINGDYLRDTAFFAPPVVDENRVTLNATSLAGETKGDGTLATLTFEVVSAKASTLTLSEVNLVNSAGKKTRPKVEGAQIMEPTLIEPALIEPALDADVNGDGSVDAQDLVTVQDRLGQTGPNSADVNGDGIVDIADLTLVAGAIGNGAAAPSLHSQFLGEFTVAEVKLWLSQAQRLDLTDPRVRRGILFLEQLLAALLPKETVLLPNYPNPFNPETWIPYRLAEDAFVTLTIYDGSGQIVRTLDVGHRVAAFYESRSKAIYWDGRNKFGEQVASGIYFYNLSAGDYSATRKMLIIK